MTNVGGVQTEDTGESDGDTWTHPGPPPLHPGAFVVESPVLAEAEVEDTPRVRRELGADAPVPTRRGTECVEQRVCHPPSLRHGVRRDDAAVSHRHPFVFRLPDSFALYPV